MTCVGATRAGAGLTFSQHPQFCFAVIVPLPHNWVINQDGRGDRDVHGNAAADRRGD